MKDMDNLYEKLENSSKYIRESINYIPETGVILGSGLGALVDNMKDKQTINYEEIPDFPQVTVKGHEGRLVFGTLRGKKVMMMQGRFHFYEGFHMKEVTYPVYVMKLLGIPNMIVTNSCGGINPGFEPGTLMLISDFINFMPSNPLVGPNDERLGPRFPDMSEPYNLKLMETARKAAARIGLEHREGVYCGFMGPCYETAAEIRAMGVLGADAVGMSTVPETMTANYLGMDALGIACITNMATGIQKMKHSHDRVLEIAKKSSSRLCGWIEEIIGAIGERQNG